MVKVNQGRDPDLMLSTATGEVALRSLATELLDNLGETAQLLDSAVGGNDHDRVIRDAKTKVLNPEATPSGRILREMRENHAIEHTTVLDVLEDLPFIRRAIFQSPSLCDGEKLMWWSLVTSSIDHANRPSEVSRFCPTLEMVALPGSARPVPHGFDSMGFPKWLEIKRDRCC